LRKKNEEQTAELKKLLKEIEEKQKKTDKEIDKVAKDIGGGLGRAAEGMAAPAVPKVFRELGFKVISVHTRVKSLDEETGEVKAEVDLLCLAMLNGKRVVLVGEVSAHLTSDDIKIFVEEELPNFKINYSDYAGQQAYAFVAGLNIDDHAARFAHRKGLYILAPSGETMHILNPVDFKPKVW
jgi:hypothetical protein